MSKPTVIDNENAMFYSLERQKLEDFNSFLKTMPHIFSHVNVEIRSNQDLPAVNELQFNRNIKVRLIGTKTFCEQVHCNSYYPRGQSCTLESIPFIFKSGNSDIPTCHSSCFNLFNQTKDGDGNYYKAPFTMYNESQKCCMIHNDAYFRLGNDDYTRTDVHPTARIDTIGTGFDLSPELYKDGKGNETFHYKINKYYCDDFKYEFKNGECEPSLAEVILGAIGSENLYKGVQYGIRDLQTGVGLHDVNKPTLPSITTKPPPSFIQWMSTVNKDVNFFNIDLQLSDLGITKEKSHLFFTTEYGWPGRLVEPIILYKPITDPDALHKDFSYGKNYLPQFQLDAYGRRVFDEYELIGTYAMLRKLNKEMYDAFTDDGKVYSNAIYEFFKLLGEQLETWEFYATTGATFLNEFSILLKKLVTFSEAQFKKVTNTMITIAERTIFHTFVSSAGIHALKYGKYIFKFLSSTIKALSVVGTIFDVLGLVDLFLIGSDLFSTGKLVGQQFVDLYSESDFDTYEKLFGYKSVEFSPVYFMTFYKSVTKLSNKSAENLILIKNAYNTPFPYATTAQLVDFENQIFNTFKWNTEYLLFLNKNSNGETISWNDTVNLKEFDDMVDNQFLKVPNSFSNYKVYTQDFLTRKNTVFLMVGCSIIVSGLTIWLNNKFLLIFAILIFMITFTLITTPN